MKAAAYYENGPPDVFRYETVDEPVCGPDDVLMEIQAISVEGGDLINREIRPLARTEALWCAASSFLHSWTMSTLASM